MLNQIKEDAIKDDETIKDLRSQNSQLLFQVGRLNDEVTELKAVMKDLQQLATKLTASFEPNKKGCAKK